MSATEYIDAIARQLQSVSGAKTTETFNDTEEKATKMAQANPCLVPEMSNELYDCCGSETVEDTCTTIGTINCVLLGTIVLSWFYLVCTNMWFRNQLLLSFTFLFQLLPAVWRTWFYLDAGFKGASPGLYITIRSSDSGDFVCSYVAFAMYLYQL